MAKQDDFFSRQTKDNIIGGLIFGGGALGMYGSYAQGQRAMDIAEYNEDALNLDARRVGYSGVLQANQFKRYAADFMAKQKSQIATSGFARSGTAVDVLVDSEEQLALKLLDMQESSRQKQETLRAQAQMVKAKGKAAKRGSYFDIAATGFGTAKKLFEVF